jgi:hypothetical protein
MIDDDECETVGGMIIDRGNLNTGTKSALVPFYSPQIPYNLM